RPRSATPTPSRATPECRCGGTRDPEGDRLVCGLAATGNARPQPRPTRIGSARRSHATGERKARSWRRSTRIGSGSPRSRGEITEGAVVLATLHAHWLRLAEVTRRDNGRRGGPSDAPPKFRPSPRPPRSAPAAGSAD